MAKSSGTPRKKMTTQPYPGRGGSGSSKATPRKKQFTQSPIPKKPKK